MNAQRPDADQLLSQIQEQAAIAGRGKLKIFFGASPGVGKTYAMLLEGQRLRAEGLDVIVGVIETHGRGETAVLLEGLEVLPRKELPYRGRILEEFDLDAALKRRPAVLLVDELAHANAPGCRHPKRWQDIEELLAAGIDVRTTVNVQHIESLNDIVGGITGIRVNETVPDHVFSHANEIVLIDLPPDDLLLRLKEGKVYLPDQAARAIENFFRKGNLIALRELALRQTADRVDDQMRAFRRTTTQTRVWQTRETLLASIGPADVDEKVVRSAARLAAKLDSKWHAVYVESPKLQKLPETRRREILATLKLAQDLGAETTVLSATDPVMAVIDYARRNNLGRIVVGRSTRARWLGHHSFSQRLGIKASDIDIVTVAREEQRPPSITNAGDDEEYSVSKRQQRLADYIYALLVCTGITIFATPLLHRIELANIVMLFLLGVVLVAYRFGRGPAVFSAFLSVASFDIFFVSPSLSLTVNDVQYLLTFAVMLIVGLVTGGLTAGLRYQARVAHYREQRSRSLYEMAKSLSSQLVEDQVIELSEKFLETNFRAKAAITLPDADDKLQSPITRTSTPPLDLAIAQWCFDKNEPAGAGTNTLPASPQLYLPLKAPARVRGVLVIEPRSPRLLMIPEQRRLLDTFTVLVAIALERIHFVAVAQTTLINMESERLRNALLAALSHDLRTPLTALVGMAETLSRELSVEHLPYAEKADIIREQALLTSRMVNNLLDMARLESGQVKPRTDWQSFEEIVGGALKILEPTLRDHPTQVTLAPDTPLVKCDAILMERVFVNLLENAGKYTPPGTTIGINIHATDGYLRVEVWDDGPGIIPGWERTIFKKFTRGQKESAIPGAGLGLAICEAIVKAHGGKIWAENRAPRGACFIFTLPSETQPNVLPEVQE